MTLAVTFRRAAHAEFLEAAARYEAQRPDWEWSSFPRSSHALHLSRSNLSFKRSSIGTLAAWRCAASHIAFTFELSPLRIVVFAVFHGNRDPAIWQSRA